MSGLQVAIREKETIGEGHKMTISLNGFLKAIRGLPQINSYLGLRKYATYAPYCNAVYQNEI